MNKREVKDAVVLLQEKLKKEAIPVQKMVLFGSYASNKPHIDSDIDVAIVLPADISPSLRKKAGEIFWWAKQINVKLEPHVLSDNDLRNRFFSLSAEIKKHGITI
ncbi:MAG: nucleotidyltransferase domain-containing protein [Candidatus Pacebacteria bacterium]|nr:nucleotidyltransferase domain-containing protein [Candidatus Paceibacterota bacterium]